MCKERERKREMSEKKKREKKAAGLVIFRRRDLTSDPQWLLLQTSYGEHHWTPPKGHLDPGEV